MHKLSPMLWLSAAALVASSLGCAMCNTDHLCDYAGVGGKWQRGNPTCGRVGSILSDAGAYENAAAIDSGAAYGDSWGLVDGIPVTTEGSQGIEQDVVESQTLEGEAIESDVIEGDVIEGDAVFDEGPDSSSILIGQ